MDGVDKGDTEQTALYESAEAGGALSDGRMRTTEWTAWRGRMMGGGFRRARPGPLVS